MGKIILDRMIKEILSVPGVHNASVFNKTLELVVRKHITDSLEIPRAKSEVAREVLKILRASREKAS